MKKTDDFTYFKKIFVETGRVEVFDADLLLKTLCCYYWGTENILGINIKGHKVFVKLKNETEV